jgi:outer membrane protein OmpA-like peptidoglycan-associated protein
VEKVAPAVPLRRSVQKLFLGVGSLLLWVSLIGALRLSAASWPWAKQPPDHVTASCSIQPAQVDLGSAARLHARVEATDTRKHPLAYVWSANGGQILGSGPDVELDASHLVPGAYTAAAAVQDAYKNRAECTAQFQVIIPDNPLTARCTVEPSKVEPGATARVKVDAGDRWKRPLRFHWFNNGGELLPEGPEAQWQTANLAPGEYTVTTRVEDDWGHATDCAATLTVALPPPPPVPPELLNLAQIVFPRNGAQLSAAERKQLQKVVDRLRSDSKGRVSVESYAAPDETRPQKLAAARAGAVRQFLVGEGVSDERIRIRVGLGGKLGGTRNRTLDVIWIPEGMEY